MDKTQAKHSFLLLLTSLIWGTAFVAQSEGMDYVGPLTFSCVRSLLGGAVLLPCIWLLGRSGKKEAGDGSRLGRGGSRKELWKGGILCGVLLCLATNFQQFGMLDTTVGKAGFITACYIVIVPVLGLFLHRKCSPFVWMGVFLATAGL